MRRPLLEGWLLASALCATFAIAPTARAAKPLVPPATTPGAANVGVKPPASVVLSPAPTSRPVQGRREARILGLRLPTFIAFGLGSLSAGGAVASGVAARRGNDPGTCDSRCTEHAVTQKRLLVATGVLTGMAAVGVGVGVTFMVTAPKDPKRDAIRPRFDLGLSGQKAVAKVGWVFRAF